jgi:invasion protein IalB
VSLTARSFFVIFTAMHRLALSLVALALVAPPAWSAKTQKAPPKTSAAQPAQAPAQNIVKLGNWQGWEAFTDTVKNEKICYLIGKPVKTEPQGAKRSAIFASVTHRPSEKRTNEVSFTAGYLFKEGSDAELSIDGKKFSLFTNKDGAWTQNAQSDKAVVEALAKGKQAVIKGTSTRGTQTTDTYALAGFSQALTQIDKACGVKQ